MITDHNVRETLKIVDKVYIVNEGSIFFEGLPEDAVKDEKIRKFYLGSEFNLKLNMLVSANIKNGINGIVKIPGDKSISHRSIIIPSISNGVAEISNLLMSDDVMHTLNALKAMGVNIVILEDRIVITGKGLHSLKEPKKQIYLGNSGTSARLLTGLLSSQDFNSTLTGDESLSRRPMKRIIEPLQLWVL